MNKIELSFEDIIVIDKYQKITPLSDDMFFAVVNEYRDVASGHIIDATGRDVVSGFFRDVKSTDGEEFVVSFIPHKYVVIDKNNKQKLFGVYKDIILMGNGLYAVTEDFKEYCVINQKGNIVSDCVFKYAKSLGIGLTVCTLCSGGSIIFENGNEIARINNDSIDIIPGCKDAFSFKPNQYENKYIIVDKYGKQIVPGTYQKILSSDGNHFSVLTLEDSNHPYTDIYKFINRDGKEIQLGDGERKVVPLGNNIYAVGSRYSYRVIDIDNNQVFPDTYVDVQPLDGNLFALETNHISDYFKLVDKEGKQVVPREYKSIHYLGSGLFSLKNNTINTIVIDQDGNRANGFYYYSQRICFNGDYVDVTATSLEELREKVCKELKRIKYIVDEFSSKIDGIITKKQEDNEFLIKNNELVTGMKEVRILVKK